MAGIEIRKVEERLDHRLLFSVRLNAEHGAIEFPIGVADQGSATKNESAVLASALGLAEEFATTVRRQLDASARP